MKQLVLLKTRDRKKCNIFTVLDFARNLNNPRVNWEFLKYKIFRFSKRYANEKAEKRKRKRVFLENKVLGLEKQIVNPPSISDALVTDYEGAKTELENLYNYIADGVILRSKVRWYEEGEKCSKYFLSLEKCNKTSSCICKLLMEESQEITNPEHIRKEIKSFYEILYTKRSLKTEKECLQYLSRINTPQLLQSDKAFCDGKLTLQNIWEALISMKNGKTPGNDGLTMEFFVCFFGELGMLLLKCLNYSHLVGELSTSQKQAIVTLIEKKGRDKRIVKNWRPISLMNVDVKIASKALSFRLRKVISTLINYDQTAYIKGRFIGESIQLIDDILYHTEQESIDRVLFTADIQKAFDSVEHSFIFAVLKKFGFGDDFIQWIKTFLFNASSCVMNNNFSTGYFKIGRGTRQDDPISAYIFILCLEIFSIQVRSDISIRGFKYSGVEIKLTAFADDTMFLVRDI